MNELRTENIRHFKLSSGEEIISNVVSIDTYKEETQQKFEYDNSMIILRNPLLINSSIANGITTSFFTKWQPLSKDSFCFINPFHIISHVECNSLIKQRYSEVITIAENDFTEEAEGDEINNDEEDSNTITFLSSNHTPNKKMYH